MAGKDPIIAGVAGRYATALFDLANENSQLDQIASDLDQFQSMLDESTDLASLVRSPVYSAADQQRALAAVLEKAGISGLTANFIGLIAKNRRLFVVSDIIKAYRMLLSQHRGEISAEVASATALSDEQMEALRTSLKEAMGKDVQIQTSVDPALLGGLIVKVGSRMIDNSLRTKLSNLKLAMKEVG